MELLPERHRHGVLHLRAPDLEHVMELERLGQERLAKQRELVEEAAHGEHDADLDRRRVDVVRRLAAVRVVDGREERVVALLATGRLERDVGDHLVGVHVRRGAGAALDHVDLELLVELAVDHPLRGPVDHLGLGGLEHADVAIRARRGLLDHRERDHHLWIDRDRPPADRKVGCRPGRVDAPVGVGRDLQGSQGIGFESSARDRVLCHGAVLVSSESDVPNGYSSLASRALQRAPAPERAPALPGLAPRPGVRAAAACARTAPGVPRACAPPSARATRPRTSRARAARPAAPRHA